MNSKPKQKILFILLGTYPLFHPDSGMIAGGAEMDLYNVAKQLNKDKFDINFIVGDFGQPQTEIIDNIILHKGSKIKKGNVFTGIMNFLKLAVLIFRVNPDIIFSKGVNWQTIELIILKIIQKKKIIIKSSHIRNIDGSSNASIHGKIFSKLINFIDVFLLQNLNDIELFQKTYPYFKNKLLTIRNFQNIPPYQNRSFSKNLLWVGRPEKFKRPEKFLELALLLPDWNLTMIMPSSNNEIFFRSQKEATEMKNVRFLPGVPGTEIGKYYLNNHFLVSTSESEGFPNVMLEAMKHGTSILSFIDFDGMVEKNHCGKIIKTIQEAPEILSEISPEEWETMSENCHRFAKENFDAETSIKKYEDIFLELLPG